MANEYRRDKLLEDVPCNLCGSSESILLYPDTLSTSLNGTGSWMAYRNTAPNYGVHPPIVTCQHCDLVRTNPRLPRNVVEDNYEAVEDPHYVSERRAREATFRRRLRTFHKVAGPAKGRRILDVGANIGVFVQVAAYAGWEAWGLEPSQWAAAYGQRQGLNLVQGTLETGDFEPNTFDVVSMWDVIEHLYDPLGSLKAANRLLKPGGWMVVHTMDIDSLFARLMRSRWPWLMEMHISYFSRHTLSHILQKAGFQVIGIRPEARHLSLNYLATRLQSYSRLLSSTLGKAFSASGLGQFLVLVNFGDLITAYAQKTDEPGSMIDK